MAERSMEPGTDYSSNSHKSKEAAKKQTSPSEEKKPKVEAIPGVSATQVKVPLGRKIVNMFKGDDAQGVGSYLANEVVVPMIKDLITSIAREGVERMMYGDARPASRSSSRRGGSYTAYNSLSSNSRGRDEPLSMSRSARAQHDFRDIVVPDRGSADLVIERISDILEEYGAATVADMLELVGITPAFTDNKFGWVDIRGFNIRRTREGYMIVCPRTVSIE